MKHPLKAVFCGLTVLVLSCGFSECTAENMQKWMDPEYVEEISKPPKAAVTIQAIVRNRQAEMIEKMIPTYSGSEICVNSVPLINSKYIKSIEAVKRPGDTNYYDLKLNLNETGRKLWIALSNNNIDERVAFVIDGMFYRSFKPRLLIDDLSTDVIVDGRFDQATALEIQNQSKLNYDKLNK